MASRTYDNITLGSGRMADRDVLVQRAIELVPMLRERALETEQLRQLPQETIDALHATELLRAAQPARYGGLGLDLDVVFDVAAELGQGCGSAAWCYSIWASHNWLVGMFPEEAQEEYWGESPDVLSSTSFNPSRGRVSAAPGGYQVSGQWDFSSGCDAATWVLLIGNGPTGPLMLMLPRSDYEIEDTWFVSGLRGTGSKDIMVDNVFVPEHRTVSVQDMREGHSPGRKIHSTPNYRVPQQSILPFALASPILGMAQGALEAFEAKMRHDVTAREGNKLAEMQSIQIRLGEAAAEVWAARSIMKQDCQEIFSRARRNEMPTMNERVRYRRDQAYVAKLSVRAINRLFEVSGGRSLFDSSAIQRFHRDAHAASHHVGLAWDTMAEQYGRVRLGLPPNIPNV
jgi:3-hydroxy-9,10-secoandrosta-1,3,5(10)-triene-9,17-dione monooxygenase